MARRRPLSSYSDLTPIERARKAREEMAELREASLESLTTDSGWAAFLEARIRHTYSWRNCALIAHQRPGALAVGTYSQHGAQGFQVQRDEHCIRITGRNPKGGFRTLKLFDICQTDARMDQLEDLGIGPVDDEVGELFAQFPTPASAEDAKAQAEAVDAATREEVAA